MPPSEQVKDFDFAVLRYKWTAQGGKDLDIRAYLEKPNRQTQVVGWKKLPTDNGYLVWNGDNQASGVESVLINLKKIATDYPSYVDISVILRAFWYSSVSSGDLVIEFVSYKGGEMTQSGFDWVNSGGSEVEVKELSLNTKETKSNDSGEHLATLSFNLNTKSGALSKAAK